MNTQPYSSLSQLIFALNEELMRTAYSPSFTFDKVSQLDQDTSAALATIREWRNSFIRVNRIPLEVLSLIPTYLTSPGDRRRASSVCRHWRRTFLQRAELWSQLFLSYNETYVKILLERTKESALDVIIGRGVTIGAMALLSSQTRRMKSLKFNFNSWTDICAFSGINSGPLPLLHTLIISDITEETPDDFALVTRPSPLLFSGAVNLRVFHLNWTLPWSPSLKNFLFPNLTIFDLFATPGGEFYALQLFDFLEASQVLRKVRINLVADISFLGVPREKIVVLPNVENFDLTVYEGGPGYKMATHISCPSARYTSLTYIKFDGGSLPEEIIFPDSSSWDAIISQYSGSPVEQVALKITPIPLISCKLVFLSPGPNVIELCFQVDETGDEDELDLPSMEMRNEVFTQAVRFVRNHPQLENLKRLYICQSPLWPGPAEIPYFANEIGALFNSVGPLDELTLSNCDLRSYFPSFLELQVGYAKPAVFPPTKTLTISHAVYEPLEKHTTAIAEFAKLQHASGTPLERVVIRGESMPVGMEEGLRPWVSSVVWEYCCDESCESDSD